jgi:hypothetical protein
MNSLFSKIEGEIKAMKRIDWMVDAAMIGRIIRSGA